MKITCWVFGHKWVNKPTRSWAFLLGYKLSSHCTRCGKSKLR